MSRVLTPPLVAASVLAIVGLSGWASSAWRGAAPAAKRMRFAIAVPDSARIRPDISGQNFTISPDGSEIVYRGGSSVDQLWLRSMNELQPRPIPGTLGASQAKFSPDGRWLGFIQNGLKKIPMPGGPAVSIADSVAHFAWADGDAIVFTKRGALWRVSAAGGVPVLVAAPDTASGQAYNWPHVLPSGKAALFDIVTRGVQSEGQLAVVRLDDGKVVPLGITGRNPRYVATGHILFGRLDGTVSAAPFDARALKVTGPAVTVLDDIYTKSGGAGEYGVSHDGTLFYVQGSSYGEVVSVDRTGRFTTVLADKRSYGSLRASPTTGRFAFHMADRASFSKTDIWAYDDLTRTVTRLTNNGSSSDPAWMADGQRLVWLSRDSAGVVHVRRQRWDGTGPLETLFQGATGMALVTPSPTGRGFGVTRIGPGFQDVYYADGETASSLRPLVVTPNGEGGATISPDGRWLAYYGDESGQREVYVIAVSGEGGRHQISTEGGGEPVWSRDGKTLFYRAGGRMIAAGIATSPAFAVTSRDPLFADRFRGSGSVATYDVMHDGMSFLMLGSISESSQRIVVVSGWLDELRERMGVAGRGISGP